MKCTYVALECMMCRVRLVREINHRREKGLAWYKNQAGQWTLCAVVPLSDRYRIPTHSKPVKVRVASEDGSHRHVGVFGRLQ